MKYEQTADGLPPLGGEELNLIQQTAAHGLVQRREHLLNGAVIWRVEKRRANVKNCKGKERENIWNHSR